MPQPTTLGQLCDGLKTAYRVGFRLSGVDDQYGESAHTHSGRLGESMHLDGKVHNAPAQMAWANTRPRWHDVSDYELVDITPHDGISQQEQLRMEWEIVQWATALLGRQGEFIRECWLASIPLIGSMATPDRG
jgi:hypothetical protein